jgi:hypothetical protein
MQRESWAQSKSDLCPWTGTELIDVGFRAPHVRPDTHRMVPNETCVYEEVWNGGREDAAVVMSVYH